MQNRRLKAVKFAKSFPLIRSAKPLKQFCQLSFDIARPVESLKSLM